MLEQLIRVQGDAGCSRVQKSRRKFVPETHTDGMALPEFVGSPSDGDRHRLPAFEVGFHHLLHLIDSDVE